MSDGDFQQLVLIHAAFPLSLMVCQFGADEQFREALIGIVYVKSFPT